MENLISPPQLTPEDFSKASFFISKSKGFNPIFTEPIDLNQWAFERMADTGETYEEVILDWAASCIDRLEILPMENENKKETELVEHGGYGY